MRNSLFICFLLAVTPVWSQPGQLSLRQALQTAQQNSPLATAGQYDVAVAEANVIVAGQRPNPVLNNQSLSLVKPALYPVGTQWHSPENMQVWWQLTKPFQLPAQRRLQLELARKNVTLVQKQLSEAERNLYRDVAVQWLETWAAQQQVALLKQAVTASDSLLAASQAKFDRRQIPETEVMRIRLSAGNYAFRLRSAQQALDQSSARLGSLLGMPGAVGADTNDHFLVETPVVNDSLLQQATHSRSDIQLLRSAVDAAGADVELQRALVWPQPELGVIYNPQNTLPYVGFFGTIELPVFSRNQGEIKRSVVLQQQAEEDLASAEEQVQSELTAAYAAYNDRRASLDELGQLLSQSEMLFQSVRDAYASGATSVADYLEAQRSCIEMQQLYSETLRQYRESYIRLLYAAGSIDRLAQ